MRKNTFLKTNFQSPSKVLMFQKNFVIWNALTVRERPFYIIKTSVLTALEYYSIFAERSFPLLSGICKYKKYRILEFF